MPVVRTDGRRAGTVRAWARLLLVFAAAVVLATSMLVAPLAPTAAAQDGGEEEEIDCSAPGNAITPECNGLGGDSDDSGSDDEEEPRTEQDDPGGGSDEDGGSGSDGGNDDDGGGSGGGGDGSADEQGQGSGQQSADTEDPGGIAGKILEWFQGILQWVYDVTIGWWLGWLSEVMSAALLPLPDMNQPVVDFYETVADTMRPAVLVGVLVVGLLMMLKTANYDVAYASFSAFPRIVGVAIALMFLPDFMQILSGLADGISQNFFPSGESINEAGFELYKAGLGNYAGVVTSPLQLLLMVGLAIVTTLVIIVAILKNIFFMVLFIAGPFALVASLLPGLSSLAGSWFRGLLACAAIPCLWAIEVGVGTFIITRPEAIFGAATNQASFLSNSVVTTIGALLVLWVMYKTPFKVLSWAFVSYSEGGGPMSSVARGVAVRGAVMGIGAGVGKAVSALSKSGKAAGTASSAASASPQTGRNFAQFPGKTAGSQSSLGAGSSQNSLGGSASSSQNALPGAQQSGISGGSGEQKALPPAITNHLKETNGQSHPSAGATYNSKPYRVSLGQRDSSPRGNA